MPENVLQLVSFKAFWQLGYKAIIPIVPHNAEISAKSSLTRSKNSPLGKVPGRKNRDGTWSGFDWIKHKTTEDDLLDWSDMGAGVGVRTGLQPDGEWSLIAIDADILTEANAKIAKDIITDRLGKSPIRIGNYPKALYLFKLRGSYDYCRIDFGDQDDKGNFKERVEILTDRRQFVAQGLHPKTLMPYSWPRQLLPFDELPIATPEQLDALMLALRVPLNAQEAVRTSTRTPVSQEGLQGRAEMIRAVVDKIPNTSRHFGTREDYVRMGYAIKAAVPDEFEAFRIFEDWCDRWQNADGRTNDPEIVESDWARMKPPYDIGATWLYNKANEIQPDSFDVAPHWFEPLPDEPAKQEDPWQAQETKEARPKIRMVGLNELRNLPPPEWLLNRHLPMSGMGFIYGAPGTFKSFIALDIAMHMAYGLPTFHGDELKAKQGDVIYVAAEGFHDLGQRVKAWELHNGVEPSEAAVKFVPQVLNLMKPETTLDLIAAIEQASTTASIIFVDTVSRAMPGADENLQKEMTLFIAACDKLRDKFNCVVIGIHHSNKAGADMRGSSVFLGAADFVLRMDRDDRTTRAKLVCEKQKSGPDGWSDQYELLAVGGSLVPRRVSRQEQVERATRLSEKDQALQFMQERWEGNKPLSNKPNAKDRFAPVVMMQEFGGSRQHWIDTLAVWEEQGLIKYESRPTGGGGKRQPGYEVLPGAINSPTGEPDTQDLSQGNVFS